jgi:multidrug efflux pump subunit AcrB
VGISTKAGGNVVTMGEAVQQRLVELEPQIPLGMQFGTINYQAKDVVAAIDNFIVNLLAAVVIVVVVLLLFMGLKSGLIIGFVLLQTILGSFIVMAQQGVALERISLGALIIALGMLVDNAIVVIDGMLVKIGKGEDPEKAAIAVCKQTAFPLLGATVIAILAFAAIGTSDDSTGEFCRSLFTVVMISLGLSWVTAMTTTPLLGVWFLKPPKVKPAPAGQAKPKKPTGGLAGFYKGFVGSCIRFRWITVIVVVGLFVGSLMGFKYVDQSFFPASTKPQFFMNIWAPEGTHLDDTEQIAAEIEEYILAIEGVEHVNTVVGQGPLRYVLTLTPEKANTAYAQLIIDVDDAEKMTPLLQQIEKHIEKTQPDLLAYGALHELGPGSTGKVQARFQGPDIQVLRELGEKTLAIFEADPMAKSIRTDWRDPVKVIRPVLDADQANRLGITRPDVANAIKETFQGYPVARYRERNDLLPVILRAPERWRGEIDQLYDLQIESPIAGKKIPLRQVVTDFEVTFEDPIIMRRDRQRTFTVFADPSEGPATKLFDRVRPQVEAIPLPPGYELFWDGEYLNSKDAKGPLKAALPLFVVMMVLICIALFNSVRHAAIIWICVPLSIIGVTVGLLSTGQPFGFMALLGALALIGMLIKNVIVLLDEVDSQRARNVPPLKAVIESGASRLRPVAMAAGTTAMGLIPLFPDVFFGSLAVTIVGGLAVATLLTVILVPVLYAIFFRVKWDKSVLDSSSAQPAEESQDVNPAG